MARLAAKTDAGVVAEVLARAFVADPVIAAFIRNGPDRTARLARYFELECRPGFAGYGEIWLDDESLGAAIWRRPNGYPEPLRPSSRRCRSTSACSRASFSTLHGR